MHVKRGTWSVRNVLAVATLAVTFAVVLWIRLLGPGAIDIGESDAAGFGPANPISGDLNAVRSNRPGLRVLFVGNSFTAANGMTAMVQMLAKQDRGARPVFAAEYAPGGSQLEMAVRDERLTRLIAGERWDVVVLQEQSAIPSWGGYREAHMFPAAEKLAMMARERGARTVLFMTWGYKDGDQHEFPGNDSYPEMQERVAEGYTDLSLRLRAPVASVGLAWQRALDERPGTPLWAADGQHPSEAGSYLAACVLYASLVHRDLRRSRYTAGLDRAEARWLKQVATPGHSPTG